MTTVLHGGDAGSPRACCVLMTLSYIGQLWVRNLFGQNPAFFRGLLLTIQKNRTGMGSHPSQANARLSAAKAGYVRRSELIVLIIL
jgi:hypothetical protein